MSSSEANYFPSDIFSARLNKRRLHVFPKFKPPVVIVVAIAVVVILISSVFWQKYKVFATLYFVYMCMCACVCVMNVNVFTTTIFLLPRLSIVSMCFNIKPNYNNSNNSSKNNKEKQKSNTTQH